MENDGTKHLHVVWTFAQNPACGFAREGKGFGQKIVKGFSCGETAAEFRRFFTELFGGQ